MKIKKAIILGAGFGKRMYPITKKIPKPLVKIKNKTILENSISFLKKRFKNISYKEIVKFKLHSEQISNHSAIIAKNRNIRKIINIFQKTLIKKNKKIYRRRFLQFFE